jgi:hypothetical protein
MVKQYKIGIWIWMGIFSLQQLFGLMDPFSKQRVKKVINFKIVEKNVEMKKGKINNTHHFIANEMIM